MLKELLDLQKEYANHFLDTLDLSESQKVLDILINCQGIIFFTGIGKSGLVAKKIAFTMVSTGTRALYISPTDALHGDLGMVSENDVFVVLSKSGESDELLNLLPAIRNKGAILCSVVCNASSRLAEACHHSVTLPVQRELCPFDMAPTMSTTAQLMFGDLLTIAIMKNKNFGLDQYALNHPSGRIGKRITLKVRDLMLTGKRIPLCDPKMLLSDALIELSDKRCGAVLIVDEKKQLLGIFTDGDLRRALQKLGSDALTSPIEQLMITGPLFANPTEMAWEAMKRMEGSRRITVLPVLDADRTVVGIIHLHDIIQSGI